MSVALLVALGALAAAALAILTGTRAYDAGYQDGVRDLRQLRGDGQEEPP